MVKPLGCFGLVLSSLIMVSLGFVFFKLVLESLRYLDYKFFSFTKFAVFGHYFRFGHYRSDYFLLYSLPLLSFWNSNYPFDIILQVPEFFLYILFLPLFLLLSSD